MILAARTCVIPGLCIAVFGGLPATAQDPQQPRPGQSSFFNAGKVLVLGVDITTSRLSGPEEFLPVQMIVINRKGVDLTITPESFTVVRPDGVSLPLVSAREFWSDYPLPRADLRTSQPFFESVFGRYPPPTFNWTPLDFFPDEYSGVVPRDGITLRRADGVFGMIYFRHPEDIEIPTGGYKLLMKPARAEETYVVDFFPYAPEKKKKKK